MDKNKITVIIDNGHGENTPGKCSPDRSLLEYKYTREIAQDLKRELTRAGIKAIILVPEMTDVHLNVRCRRANEIAREHGTKNTLLVSIHCDAVGADGKWHNVRGWSARVALNASKQSKTLATLLASSAKNKRVKVNQPLPKQPYWSQSLAICRDTICPAVLVETGFQDNKEDCAWLLSPEGRKTTAEILHEGIIRYIDQL